MSLPSRSPWVAALLPICLIQFFLGLGALPFHDKGEPREALQVWEEVHHGEWILPLRNGHEIPSKPPLFHWLAGSISLAAGGVSELTARLPSALLASSSALLILWFGLQLPDRRTGIYAALILCTSFEWVRAARMARVDMTLAATMTAALVTFSVIASRAVPPRAACLLFYVFSALAVLAKGPVAAILIGGVVIVYLALRRDLGRICRMHPVIGVALVLALAGSWYVLASLKGGEDFLDKQLLGENLLRFLGTKSGTGSHVKPFWYYLPRFFGGFAPWSLFLIPAAWHLSANRKRLDPLGELYPCTWFLVILAFYSASAGKRSVYILPLYPAAALIVGGWWSQLVAEGSDSSRAYSRVLQVIGVIGTATTAALIVAIWAESIGWQVLEFVRPVLHARDQANLPLVQAAIQSRFPALLVFLVPLALAIGSFTASVAKRRWNAAFVFLVSFLMLASTFANGIVLPEITQRRTLKPFMAEVTGIVSTEDRLVFYRAFDYGAVFYARRRIPVVRNWDGLPRDGRRTYLLMWESEARNLAPTCQAQIRLLLTSSETSPSGDNRLVLLELVELPGKFLY
jgi:4-amino-4-deoxy-L-arabinose transferase-like glycosyltransferase